MRKILTLLSLLLLTSFFSSYGQMFWVENFESGSLSGELVTAYTGPNGTWTQTIGSTEGDVPNLWYVSCAENGHTTGGCGTGCVPVTTTATGATLHIGSNPASIGGADPGAAYDAGGFCGTLYCVTTDKKAVSPVINCTGRYTITLKFYYTMDGQAGIDYATVWYYNGTTWSLLASPSQTPPICPGGQGYWDHYTVALPASANNNPNVKIGFNWVNNDDGIGTDPSFAVDSVSLTALTSSVTPTPSYSVSPSYTICADSCIHFTNTSTGTVDSFRWTVAGGTPATATTSPVTACFSIAGTYTVTLTDYRSGTSYTASHVVTVNPAPHPVIHYSGVHTLSVTGSYSAFQWLNGASVIAGATNSSYSTSTGGAYYVGVDSGGCWGYSAVPFTFSTTELTGLNQPENNFWLYKNPSSGKMTLNAGRPLDADINVLIYDATGRVLVSDIWLQGDASKDFDADSLPKGFYFIRFANQSTQHVMKWVK